MTCKWLITMVIFNPFQVIIYGKGSMMIHGYYLHSLNLTLHPSIEFTPTCIKIKQSFKMHRRSHQIYPNYSNLTRPHLKWWFSKGTPLIFREIHRLVKYCNSARSNPLPWGYGDHLCIQPSSGLDSLLWPIADALDEAPAGRDSGEISQLQSPAVFKHLLVKL